MPAYFAGKFIIVIFAIVKNTTDKILTYLLTPLSWVYGGVMWVRNKLFDTGILPQVEFDVPVIGVGNITVGGTGKTPHTEYLVSQLCGSYKVAVLSRGYKRHTKGFLLANAKSSPETIGDEPWQIYNKFGMRAKVAVCESRKQGITRLLQLFPDLDLIILDDSFQHRWVKPRISILLMEYGRSVMQDHLLPLGRLRESRHEMNRADKVIVTKVPDTINPIDLRVVVNELNLMKYQKLYFTGYQYESIQPVFSEEAKFATNIYSLSDKDAVLLLTGIAHPRAFVRHFSSYPFRIKVEHFPDHHNFTRKDLQRIQQRFQNMKGERKLIITTEKDAVRLLHNPYFPQELKPFVYYQPISVKTLNGIHGNENNLIHDILNELRLERYPDNNDISSQTGVGNNRVSDYDYHIGSGSDYNSDKRYDDNTDIIIENNPDSTSAYNTEYSGYDCKGEDNDYPHRGNTESLDF